MTTGTSVAYKQSLVAATAALVISSAIYQQIEMLPNENYFIPYTEDDYLIEKYRYVMPEIGKSIVKKDISTINDFIAKLANETKDLDTKVVDLVNDNFWDLL